MAYFQIDRYQAYLFEHPTGQGHFINLFAGAHQVGRIYAKDTQFFMAALDLLRHEGPVNWDDQAKRLGTGTEPVGEDET